MLPELGPEQQRAITYLWAATQVSAKVVHDAFLEIYTSLPDSEDGHASIEDYCHLAGCSRVYSELLQQGYPSSILTSSPRDAEFLDLKVTRKMLEVLAEKWGRRRYCQLTFQVRRLVYLRNDLCHQLLPALSARQYLEEMQQLETRLSVVTCVAADIAGALHTPADKVQKIHEFFTYLAHHVTVDKPRVDSGTQASLHLPVTLEKGVQVNTTPLPLQAPVAPTAKMQPRRSEVKEGMSGTTRHDGRGSTPPDAPIPAASSPQSAGRMTRGAKTGKGWRRLWLLRNRRKSQGDAGGSLRRASKNAPPSSSDGASSQRSTSPLARHDTETIPKTPLYYPQEHPYRDKLRGGDVLKLKSLMYEAVTLDLVVCTTQRGLHVTSVLGVGFSLLVKLLLFLGLFSVSTLPVIVTVLRLLACGLQHSWWKAEKACRQILRDVYQDPDLYTVFPVRRGCSHPQHDPSGGARAVAGANTSQELIGHNAE